MSAPGQHVVRGAASPVTYFPPLHLYPRDIYRRDTLPQLPHQMSSATFVSNPDTRQPAMFQSHDQE